MSTALLLPGRAYTPEMPALFFTSLALRQAGFEPVAVEWPDPGRLAPPDVVRRITAEAIETHAPAYVVAKSMGSHAAPVVADRGIPAIWLTPLLQDADVAEALARHPGRQLLVAGDEDFAWDQAAAEAAAAAGATVVLLPRADHGYCVEGDAVASAEAHVLLTRAVAEFLAS